jgi:hypothetical protein
LSTLRLVGSDGMVYTPYLVPSVPDWLPPETPMGVGASVEGIVTFPVAPGVSPMVLTWDTATDRHWEVSLSDGLQESDGSTHDRPGATPTARRAARRTASATHGATGYVRLSRLAR